jgi:HAMP domain-containing protein
MRLRTKITFVTLATVIILFTCSMIVNTVIFYNEAKEFRNLEIQSSFKFFLEKVNFATTSTEFLGFGLARSGELFYKYNKNKAISKKDFESFLENRIQKEKSILGAGFWFEPFAFGEKYMAPYASWSKDKIKITWEYSNNKYDYHNQPFYRVAVPLSIDKSKKRETDRFQIAPYFDKIGNEEILFVTLSTLMYDENNRILGISTVDWTFENLHKLLNQFSITKSSYTVLIDSTNSKIVFHPKKDLILKDSKQLSWISKIDLAKVIPNEIQILPNEIIENREYNIYYTITSANYLLAAIIDKKEAYSLVGGIVFRNFLLSLVTIVIIGLFIFFVVDYSVKPLIKIITVLRDIAGGRAGLDERINITSKDEFGELASTFNNMANKIESQNFEIKEYSENLEEKVKTRTNELNVTLSEIIKLKKQQDGDYFLTSLLLTPLGKISPPNSETVKVEVLMKQKKTFEFKNATHAIGGDLCIVDTINLKNKNYTVFINGDAMGKSMQGAGGALILGSVFGAIIERTRYATALQSQNPERWLKNTFIELHKTFITFDGSMMVSVVLCLLDNLTGLLYLINAEHPSTVLYRDGKASFLEETMMLHKLGMGVHGNETGVYIRTFQLRQYDSIILGSDGRDDIMLGLNDSGERIINEDENLFLTVIESKNGELKDILEQIEENGELTDDFSLLKITFNGKTAELSNTSNNLEIVEYIKKSKLLESNKKYAEAFLELKKVLLIEEDHLYGIREIIKLCINLKHFQLAIDYSDRYMNLRPIDTEIIYAKSYAHKKLNQSDQAIDLAEMIRLREPRNIKYLGHLVELYIGEDPNRAKRILDEALRIDSTNKKLLSLNESLKSLQ